MPIPACLVWMIGDFASIDLEGEDEDPGYIQAHRACQEAIEDGFGAGERQSQGFSLSRSADGWEAILDEFDSFATSILIADISTILHNERRLTFGHECSLLLSCSISPLCSSIIAFAWSRSSCMN